MTSLSPNAEINELKEDKNLFSKYSTLLALSENGIGAAMHAMHLPLTGYFLSLNQIFWMARIVKTGGDRFSPVSIGIFAACLKSLSPQGKRLMPMLAIAMQGALFNAGSLLIRNRAGLILGAWLSSLWGFVQPFLFYYLIFGSALIEAYASAYESLQSALHLSLPALPYLVAACFALKMALAVVVIGLASEQREEKLTKFLHAAALKGTPKREQSPLAGALADCSAWPFLLTVAVTAFFAYRAHGLSEAALAALKGGLLGFGVFYCARKIDMEKMVLWLMPDFKQ